VSKDEVNHLGFLLLIKQNRGTNLPPEIAQLLTEFSDVIPKEILQGLPPMRDIQHTVDFIPGAISQKNLHME
jgi:hypothetical protein